MKRPNFTCGLLRVNGITGNLYREGNLKKNTLVIYGIGAPVPPDNGFLPDAPFILSFDTDLFVPDYIGFGRSEGIFTPMNCIKTFATLFTMFKKGCWAETNSMQKCYVRYKRIIMIGRSFGGMYVTLLPRVHHHIKEIASISPILDYVECGKIAGEETTELFMKAMNTMGYRHLFRGINRPVWEKHLHNGDDLRPKLNISYLSDVKLFLAHGKKDTNINFVHSVAFFNELTKVFPKKKNNFLLKLYHKGDHGLSTSNKAVVDCLKWFGLKKQIFTL